MSADDRALGSDSDIRRSLRDMGTLLTLPALWVDHEPLEIATGLLSVLFGMLGLDGAYARFNDPDGGPPLQTWRPSGPSMPSELLPWLRARSQHGSGVTSTLHGRGGGRLMWVATVPVSLPGDSGVVLVSSARSDFPTAVESNLLRLAVSQGAIAVHTARRLARERLARASAEDALHRQSALLHSLAEDVEPSLAAMSRRVHDVSVLAAESEEAHRAVSRTPARGIVDPAHPDLDSPLPLTGREVEVLGLLAQGLSNREIAGVIRLSDKTVERHITSVYRKVGVARRSEATAFAFRHGVV